MRDINRLVEIVVRRHIRIEELEARIETLEDALRGAISYIEAQLEFMASCVSDSEMVKELRAALDKDEGKS